MDKQLNFNKMSLVGKQFKTTCIQDEESKRYGCFGIHPKHMFTWGIRDKNTPIYEITFEIVEEYAKYPKDTRQIEYWCFAKTEKFDFGNHTYIPLNEPEFSLVADNVIIFTVQFCQPVFIYQHKEHYGIVCRLKIVDVKQIEK